MRSELEFGSLLVYPTRGRSGPSIAARNLTIKAKTDGARSDGEPILAILARLLAIEVGSGHEIGRLFQPGTVLVPAPRSHPLVKGALWPAHRICAEIVAAGLAGEISPIVDRTTAVAPSRLARPGERPTVQRHMDTMSVTSSLSSPDRILVVDDVITRGATQMAIARLLDQAYPSVTVQAFAISRTLSEGEVEYAGDPVVGKITMAWGQALRRP